MAFCSLCIFSIIWSFHFLMHLIAYVFFFYQEWPPHDTFGPTCCWFLVNKTFFCYELIVEIRVLMTETKKYNSKPFGTFGPRFIGILSDLVKFYQICPMVRGTLANTDIQNVIRHGIIII